MWRTTRIINYTTAVVAAPLWVLGGTIPPWTLWWQPICGAVLFFAGQLFSLIALSTGDVSVATPVLGVKILLVAFLTAVLIGDPIGFRLWTAAGLSTAAVALLNLGPPHAHRRVGPTIILAALGAAAFACFDVLLQKWSPTWGAGRLLPFVMAVTALYSIPLRRLESRPSGHEAAAALYRFPLAAGSVCLAVQGLMFASSVSIYRQAPTANVLYSSRGLWSVVGVWAIGHWFSSREQHLPGRVLIWRLTGAIFLMAAIAMVLTGAGS